VGKKTIEAKIAAARIQERAAIMAAILEQDAVRLNVCPSCGGTLAHVRTGWLASIRDALSSRVPKRCNACGGQFDYQHGDGA
jgi:uncharacterized protein with PIN domain